MKAILFTLFAPSYVQDTVIPRLRARGVHVDRTMEPRSASTTRIVEDLVLFMHEFGPHANDTVVRQAAKSQNKQFMYLTRKSANWPDELRDPKDVPKDTADAEVTTLSQERLESVLRTVMALRDAGQSYDAIAPQLKTMWRFGEHAPADGRALRRMLEEIRERGTPEWFVKWTPKIGASASPYAPPDKVPDEDDAELLRLFEEDNQRLQEELQEAREQLEARQKELATALDAATLWEGEYNKLKTKANAVAEHAAQDAETARKSIGELRERIAKVDRAWTTSQANLAATQEALTGMSDRLAQADARSERLSSELTAALNKTEATPPPQGSNGLGAMLVQVRSLVPNILSAEEALDRLAAYAKKEGA